MLHPALISTYRRYKNDTNAIASWLASTARSVGFPTDNLSASGGKDKDKPGAGGRLKGKARTEAKKRAAASESGNSSSYIISTKDYIALAEYVREKSVPVPKSFADTIDRVVKARTGFSSKLEQTGSMRDEEADAKHDYFVDGKSPLSLCPKLPDALNSSF